MGSKTTLCPEQPYSRGFKDNCWTLHRLTSTFFWAYLLLSSCQSGHFTYDAPKMEGVSLVAPPQPMGPEVMQELQALGVEWVSLMPYAFLAPGDTILYYNIDRQWWGERDEGLIESIRLAKEAGLQVMLKPHLWLKGGAFTGDFGFPSAESWKTWERAYTGYILHHARIADSTQLPLFCIGTELTQHNKARPQYWQQLIDTVRAVYQGKITYAANWDAINDFPHWGQLDYIGVDAYFPLSDAEQPSPEVLVQAWQPHLKALQDIATKHQKPILFTEWGYRSIRKTSHEPWRSDTDAPVDYKAQADAYRAFFQHVWPQSWLAGVFLWKWYPQIPQHYHKIEKDYTPQDKPAQEVVREYFMR